MLLKLLTPKLLEYTTFGLGILFIYFWRWENDISSKTMFGFIVLLAWLYFAECNFENKQSRSIDNFVRKSNGSGLWCTLLLPMALTLSCANSSLQCSELYFTMSMLTWPLVVTSIVWLHFEIIEDCRSVFSFIPLLANPIIWFGCRLDIGIPDFVVCIILFHLVFWLSAHHLIFSAVKNFTVGEAVICAQGCSLFIVAAYFNLKSRLVDWPEAGGINEFAETCNVGAGLFVLVLLYVPVARPPKGFFIMAATIGLGFIIPFSSYAIGENSLVWLANYVSKSPAGVMLMVHVVDLSVLSILVSAVHKSGSATLDRKYFHVILSLAYLPALAYRVDQLYLMSAVVFGLFIIIECIRVARFPPFGDFFHKCCVTYVSNKEEGVLILDHFHLLVGCSIPIWLFPTFSQDVTIAAYSGLLSVGVGDSLAHIGGYLYGTHFWPDGKKTLEGTAFAISGQLLTFLLFVLTGCTSFPLWKFTIAVTLSSLLESFTSQVDNTVLPLFIYSLLIC